MSVDGDWDPEKNERNIAKHDIRFEDAIDIFDDPSRVEVPSFRGDSTEIRRLVLGRLGEDVLALQRFVRVLTGKEPPSS